MGSTPQPETTRGGHLLAWGVHALTASGAAVALVSLDALAREAWREVLLWQLLALAIDGIDGTLARAARVKERVPRIDGEALDLIVDYLNYVLVPTLLMWRSGSLPEGWALPLAILIQLSSLYVFTRRDMKTEDGYFRGFPALWNVVAAYVLLLQPDEAAVALIVVALTVASFAPIHVVHPFRTHHFKMLAKVLAVVWTVSTLLFILSAPTGTARDLLLYGSLLSLVGLAGLGAWRTVRGERS